MAGRLKWYALILLGITAVPAAVIPLLLNRYKAEFHSFDDLKPADVSRLEIRLFNLKAILPPGPDGEAAPDTVGPFDAKPEDIAPLIGLLKGAKELPDLPPGPWLGEYRLTMANGRVQRVRVKFGGNPLQPESFKVWFRIGADQMNPEEHVPGFEAAGSVKAFVSAIAAAERKAAPR